MRDLIKKILREAVGVPDGIYEASIIVYENINNTIQNLSDPLFDEGETEFVVDESYNTDIFISDLKINQINLELKIIEHPKAEEVTLVSMHYVHNTIFEDLKLKTYIKDNEISLGVFIAIPENTEISDIKGFSIKNRKEIVSSLSHELMHAYDSYKSKEISIYDVTKYSGFKNISFRVKPVDEFLFLLYFIHGIENVVRPSELFANMKENNINSEEFYEFITSTEVWKNLKKSQEWNYEYFREELKNYISDIQRVLEKADVTIPHNENELIDLFLRIVYINLVNKQLELVNRQLVTNFIEMITGLSGDKKKLFSKIVNKAKRFENNTENFYLYEQSNFKKVSREIMKKISKLYSLTEKQEKKSILDWDLHHEINKTNSKFDKDFKFEKPKNAKK